MADDKSRGGQKKADEVHGDTHEHRGTTTHGAGERSDKDKQMDQKSNPDDANRTATDKQR